MALTAEEINARLCGGMAQDTDISGLLAGPEENLADDWDEPTATPDATESAFDDWGDPIPAPVAATPPVGTQAPLAAPTPVETAVAPVASKEEPKKRKRRTRAEIEADARAAQEGSPVVEEVVESAEALGQVAESVAAIRQAQQEKRDADLTPGRIHDLIVLLETSMQEIQQYVSDHNDSLKALEARMLCLEEDLKARPVVNNYAGGWASTPPQQSPLTVPFPEPKTPALSLALADLFRDALKIALGK